MSHPESTKTELPHCIFRSGYLTEFFNGDGIAILKTRRKACDRRLVPGAQLEALRQTTDFVLAEADLLQRAANSIIPCRSKSWSKVVRVIGVGAIDHDPQSLFASNLGKSRIELDLAEEATLMRIVGV